MQISFLVPILVLAIGALAVLSLSALLKRSVLCVSAAVVAGLALLALWRAEPTLPTSWIATTWRPLAMLGAPLAFAANASTWFLAAVLGVTGLLSLLGCCADSERPGGADLALILAAMGAGLAALFAASFVALVVAWGATDVLLGTALLRHGRAGTRRAALALFSGIVATASLWAAPMLAQPEGTSGFLRLAQFSGPSARLLQLAVILRLGLVPLHLWRPIDLETPPAQLIPWVVIPTVLGFDLLTYLPALTAGLPSALFALAAVTLLVGGFVAWSETEERSSLAGMMVAQTGLAVLAVANAGQQAVATAIAATVAWALGITVYALTPGWSGRRLWRALPALVALFSLIGVPPTLGFVVRFTAYSGLEAALLALVVALLGETFVIAALFRLFLWPERRPLPKPLLFELGYLLLFAAAAALLVLSGLTPEGFAGRAQDTALPELAALLEQGGITGWTGWALPIVAGLALFLVGEGFRQHLEGGWKGLGTLLRLEWVYGVLLIAVRWVVGFLRGASAVVEGEGALLWTVVILLIVLLYLTGGGVAPLGS